jgi:hypothetical protein
MRVVAGNSCPVRNIKRQPSSLVHPFSPPGHQRSDGGLEVIVGGDPVAAAAEGSASSGSRTESDESRMGWKWERYDPTGDVNYERDLVANVCQGFR